ncbi:MAG TPA: hypothetical protein VE155_07335 [Pseudonocardiaceae bacterium]|nr:hypothetical protein [Pseudonocardiaceae bacterium]
MTSHGKRRPEKMLTAPASCHARHHSPEIATARLDARHRTQAHVEDRVKQFKARGPRTLPSIDYDPNRAAWLQLGPWPPR